MAKKPTFAVLLPTTAYVHLLAISFSSNLSLSCSSSIFVDFTTNSAACEETHRRQYESVQFIILSLLSFSLLLGPTAPNRRSCGARQRFQSECPLHVDAIRHEPRLRQHAHDDERGARRRHHQRRRLDEPQRNSRKHRGRQSWRSPVDRIAALGTPYLRAGRPTDHSRG